MVPSALACAGRARLSLRAGKQTAELSGASYRRGGTARLPMWSQSRLCLRFRGGWSGTLIGCDSGRSAEVAPRRGSDSAPERSRGC